MPTTVIAAAGDTLCGLAIQGGFLNCDPLRALGDNSALLNRPLQAGDIVTIPDIVVEELDRPAEQLHQFVRHGVPAPLIRFVHGSSDRPYRDDETTPFLNISNYISNKGGANGQGAFPTTFGFNALGHADPDSFKVEVVDPNAGADLMFDLEALKPLYGPTGIVTGHEPFTVNTDLRKIRVKAQRAGTSTTYRGYRSRYMRLVTDEADMTVLSGNPVRTDGSAQGLFVSDMANGNNGVEDQVEILDQLVRATYVIQGCQAAVPNRCQVVTELPIGPNKQRIKVAFHLFRNAFPGGAGVGGINEQQLRMRTFKWYRRAYAQAELAPKLVAPTIEMVDPPPANMLVISQEHGNPASGLDDTGAASVILFDLDLSPDAGGAPAGPAINVFVDLTPGMTPTQAANAVVAALPAGFAGQVFTNAPIFTAVNGSADIIITRADGRRLMIRGDITTDTRLTVAVARTDINSVQDVHPDAALIPATIDFRRVIRAAPGADDRMDCYVVGRFNSLGLRGRAFIVASDLPAHLQPPAPLRWAAIMAATSDSGAVMDGSDNLPFTYPHESGHVFIDAFHTLGTGGSTELMSGTGTSQVNSVTATKRICDHPVHVSYAMFRPNAGPATTSQAISAVERLRVRGAPVFEGW